MGSDSKHAIWVDPLAFDHVENGPPYLPESPRVKLASAEQVFPAVVARLEGLAMAELGALVAILRAAAMVHQSHHWQTMGNSFYGDHLLFDRIYNESLPFIDQVAERAVGSGDRAVVGSQVQASIVHGLTTYWCRSVTDPTSFDMPRLSFDIETCVVGCLKTARERLEVKGLLSDGTDNLLQGVSDKHEEFLYLLQQRQGGRTASNYTYRR